MKGIPSPRWGISVQTDRFGLNVIKPSRSLDINAQFAGPETMDPRQYRYT